MLQSDVASRIRSGVVTGPARERSARSRRQTYRSVRPGRSERGRVGPAGTIRRVSSSPDAGQPVAVEPLPAAFGPVADQLPDWLPPVLAVLHAGFADAVLGPLIVGRSVSPACWASGTRRCRWPCCTTGWRRAVVAMMAEAAGVGEADAVRLRGLHSRAAAGERFAEADWRAALEPVLRELYRGAYGYAEAYASAHASASAYAQANNFTEQGAVSFAESYAAMSAGANRDAFAEANAVANAAVLAAAYAGADPRAVAEAYPFAVVQACAHAWANGAAGEPAGTADRQLAYARLAEGLAASCAAGIG